MISNSGWTPSSPKSTVTSTLSIDASIDWKPSASSPLGPAQIRLIVFDLDGTLVDSSQDLASAVNAALARIAPETPPLPTDQVRSFIGNGARVLVERSLAAHGLSNRVDDVLSIFLECYGERLLDKTHLYDGVRSTLNALASRALAVLTNKPGDMSRAILGGLGVADRFARIYGGGDLPQRKPDPAGLLHLMKELQIDPHQTLMVGDSAIDVETGRAGGTRTVGVLYGFDPESLRASRPDALIEKIEDLPALIEA